MRGAMDFDNGYPYRLDGRAQTVRRRRRWAFAAGHGETSPSVEASGFVSSRTRFDIPMASAARTSTRSATSPCCRLGRSGSCGEIRDRRQSSRSNEVCCADSTLPDPWIDPFAAGQGVGEGGKFEAPTATTETTVDRSSASRSYQMIHLIDRPSGSGSGARHRWRADHIRHPPALKMRDVFDLREIGTLDADGLPIDRRTANSSDPQVAAPASTLIRYRHRTLWKRMTSAPSSPPILRRCSAVPAPCTEREGLRAFRARRRSPCRSVHRTSKSRFEIAGGPHRWCAAVHRTLVPLGLRDVRAAFAGLGDRAR